MRCLNFLSLMTPSRSEVRLPTDRSMDLPAADLCLSAGRLRTSSGPGAADMVGSLESARDWTHSAIESITEGLLTDCELLTKDIAADGPFSDVGLPEVVEDAWGLGDAVDP